MVQSRKLQKNWSNRLDQNVAAKRAVLTVPWCIGAGRSLN